MLKRRAFILSSLGACLIRPGFASAGGRAALAPGEAINKAGRQRMLSQRMAKAFTMQVLGVMPEKARLMQELSRRLFEAQLEELKTLQPSETIRLALVELDRNWMVYREVLVREKTPENVRLVLAESEKTLRAAHALTVLYEKQSGGAAGHLVNVSGRQRMLSQRMAKCFLVEQSGLLSDAVRNELETARRDFVAALGELNAAPENTPDIRLELGLANTQWLFFEQALNGRETRDIAIRNVATTSERILEIMEGLTARYESLVSS